MTNDKQPTRGFRPLEHTADKAMEAWGATLPDLFCAAAEGMFAGGVDADRVAETQEWRIEVEAEGLEDLLRAWLSELLWLAERDESAIRRVEVEAVEADPWRVRGRAWGGPSPAGGEHPGAPVKAVTYHGLRVWQEEGQWRARVVFDV